MGSCEKPREVLPQTFNQGNLQKCALKNSLGIRVTRVFEKKIAQNVAQQFFCIKIMHNIRCRL
jgi:hypothetical protein